MTNLQKRFFLYLFGCIPIRLYIVYLAKNINNLYLPILGYISLFPAIGFAYFYFSGTREIGSETFGNKIWWSNIRPIHSMFYFIFAFNAIYKNINAWTYLLYDVIFGFCCFMGYHIIYNN